MLASGKVGHGLLRVSWELGVESSKVGVAVRARVVTAQLKLREQSMRHRGGVAEGGKVSGFSVGGSTAEAKAGVVKAAAGLCPLLVVRGQAGKRAESVPDLLVEACQRLLLQVGRYGAHAMSEFANAGAVAKETSRDLGVVELSKLVQELGGLGHFFLDVVAAEGRGADGSAKELEVAFNKDSAGAVVRVGEQPVREEAGKVSAGVAARQNKFALAKVQLEA